MVEFVLRKSLEKVRIVFCIGNKSPNPAWRGGEKLIVDSDISAGQFHKRLHLSPDYENDDDNYDDKNNYDDADGDDDEGIHENS